MQRPDLVSTDAQLAHSRRKLNNAIKSKEALSKSETQLQTKLTSLQQELASVTKAAERAQGATTQLMIFMRIFISCLHSRGTPTEFRTQRCLGRGEFGRVSSTVSFTLSLLRCGALFMYYVIAKHPRVS